MSHFRYCRAICLSLLLLSAGASAQVPVGNLPQATLPLSGNEAVMVQQGGRSKQTAISNVGSLGPPATASYLLQSPNATLTGSRTLAGTANEITLTDGGSGSTLTLATPQAIAAASSPTFANLTLSSRTGILLGNGASALTSYAGATCNPQFIQAVSATGTLTCGTPAGTGVASVGLLDGSSVPLYAITGSPVTTTGTLTVTLNNQSANQVLAGPTSSSAQPTFRALVSGDIPPINLASTANGGVLSSSILGGANGGTGNGFFAVTGPATSLKTFTYPNASATVLTSNALVTAAQGGTGNGFFAVSGPATSTKTFTFPNASATVLTSNAAVTVAQGGTGVATLTNHGVLLGAAAGNITAVAAMAADTLLQGQGAGADPAVVAVNNCGSSTTALSYSTGTHAFGCQTITAGIVTGSYTATMVGCTTSPTVTVKYTVVGNMANISVPAANCTGNSPNFSLSGAPGAITPNVGTLMPVTQTLENNSATVVAAAAFMSSSGALTFCVGNRGGTVALCNANGGFASAGPTGTQDSSTYTYSLSN